MNTLPNIISEKSDNGRAKLLNGYLRFIPEEQWELYVKVLKQSPLWDNGIPFAVTAFCDLLVWDKDGYILIYQMVDRIKHVVMHGADFFFANINEPQFQKDFFDLKLYNEALEMFGGLQNDQCYIFEPIPALGGSKELKNISIGNTLPYLSILIMS